MDAHAHDDPAAIRQQTKLYVMVFGALMVLTVVTVAVSYLHLSVVPAILVALLIAGIKGTMVAGYFMHLFSERKAIYSILLLTVAFFIMLMAIPTLWHWNQRVLVP